MEGANKNKYSLILINSLLLLGVIALIVLPFFLVRNAEFGGADGEAETVVTEIQAGYQPWFKPFWEPPSGEIESLLFALQAALGAGFIGYYVGYVKGKAGSKSAVKKA